MYSDESVVQRLANCSNYFNLFPNVAYIKVKKPILKDASDHIFIWPWRGVQNSLHKLVFGPPFTSYWTFWQANLNQI